MSKVTLKIDNSRRLTGKHYFTDQPGAVLDAFVSGVDKQLVVDIWLEQLADLLNLSKWSNAPRFYQIFENGVSVGFNAPVDALYAAKEINEAAWEAMIDRVFPSSVRGYDAHIIQNFSDVIREERNPALTSLIAAAEEKGVVYLLDDGAVSLGYGVTAETWQVDDLPDLNSLDWDKYQTLPVALVIGTNDKSTSASLTSQIIKQSGLRCGITTTDSIRVGDNTLDNDDYSGLDRTRMVLRHPETEAAILEMAHDELLRHGLPIPQVDAALVSNVAEDHLGQYGINSIAALTAATMMVAKAASKALVLNADDANLVEYVQKNHAKVALSTTTNKRNQTSLISEIAQEPVSPNLPEHITWFSLDETNPVIVEARENRQKVCFIRDSKIIYATADHESEIIDINAIPMQGDTAHNVQNALGAVALSKALGIDEHAIREVLAMMS